MKREGARERERERDGQINDLNPTRLGVMYFDQIILG